MYRSWVVCSLDLEFEGHAVKPRHGIYVFEQENLSALLLPTQY